MTPESFRTDLASAGLGPYAETIAALAKPCIQLETVPGDEPAGRVGASRLGGEPDLPPGEPWPEWQGTPMSFLVQIDLATVAGLPGADVLPSAGLLSFFCEGAIWRGDPTDGGDWRVLYTPAGTSLERIPIPDAVPEDGIFTACGLTPRPGVSLPSHDEAQTQALGLSWDESGAYLEVRDRGIEENGPTEHRLLGWPDPVQSAEMELECQIASTGRKWDWTDLDRLRAQQDPATAEWRLLLQLASDDAANMMWGDVGVLYFWIREPDLAARDFSRVWMIMQCG